MPVYKCTYMWNQSVMGVGESYWTPNVAATVAAQQLQDVLELRAALMWDDQYTVGVRVSQVGAIRSSQTLIPTTGIFPGTQTWVTIPYTGALAQGSQPWANDQLRAALQVRLSFAAGRSAIRYIAGIPKSIVGTEPATVFFTGRPSWQKAYQSFFQYLKSNGWQIAAQVLPPTAPVFNVVGVVQQSAAPGYIGIQISASTAPSIAIGQKIALHGMRPAKGTRASTMNGTWYVSSVDLTGLPTFATVYLRGSAGIDPAAQRFTDKTTLRPVTYTTYPIESYEAMRIGVHKRGRPSLAPRGRRVTRPSLDP